MRKFSNDFKYVVDLTEEQIEYSKDCASRARESKRKEGFNGGFNKLMIGYLGEIAFADLMGLPRPQVSWNDDKGIDFEIGEKFVDVKTMLLTGPTRWQYANDLNAYQVHRDGLKTNVYVFASAIKSTRQIEFTGWIKKDQISNEWLRRKGDKLPRGKWEFTVAADMYEIPNASLDDFHPRTFETKMMMFGAN